MIECIKFSSHVDGFLQGFADLYIDKMGMEVYGCSLWMKDGRRWVNMPSSAYKDKEGKQKFWPVNKFRETSHMHAFSDQAKQAIDKWCKEQAEKESPPEPESEVGVSPASSFDDSACPF